jgi:DNA-binding protein H-NS
VTDYENMPYGELKQLHERIGAFLKSRAEAERQAAREAMQKMADDHGYPSVAEMLGIATARKGKNSKRASASVKYQNPENPAETWTGKGRMPKWMQPLIEGGKNKSDFLIA